MGFKRRQRQARKQASEAAIGTFLRAPRAQCEHLKQVSAEKAGEECRAEEGEKYPRKQARMKEKHREL